MKSSDESDKEIWFLNRGVLILRPKEPFVSWVQEADPVADSQVDATFARENTGVYLIPECDGDDEAWSWIEQHAVGIFTHQVNEWYTDPVLWPAQRDWKTLNEWFELEYVEIAWDLVDADRTRRSVKARARRRSHATRSGENDFLLLSTNL